MQLVGALRDKKMAGEMRDELFSMGIEASVYFEPQHEAYYLSVNNPEDLERAKDYFRVKIGQGKSFEPDQEWVKIKTLPRGQTTFFLLMICIGIYLMSFSQMGKVLYETLFIGRPETGFLSEVFRGQIWRLITPIFLHLSLMHIVFNMMWFKDLGYLIEFKFGKNNLLSLIFISGIISNLLQYCVNGPQFGGMSGVLYAMLGFVWVYPKLNSDFDYTLPSRDIAIMIGWLLLCLTGFLGPIANAAHAGGLFIGMIFALVKTPHKWGRAHFKYFSLAFIFLAFTIGVEGLKLSGRYFILLWLG